MDNEIQNVFVSIFLGSTYNDTTNYKNMKMSQWRGILNGFLPHDIMHKFTSLESHLLLSWQASRFYLLSLFILVEKSADMKDI